MSQLLRRICSVVDQQLFEFDKESGFDHLSPFKIILSNFIHAQILYIHAIDLIYLSTLNVIVSQPQ